MRVKRLSADTVQ